MSRRSEIQSEEGLTGGVRPACGLPPIVDVPYAAGSGTCATVATPPLFSPVRARVRATSPACKPALSAGSGAAMLLVPTLSYCQLPMSASALPLPCLALFVPNGRISRLLTLCT